MDISQKINQVYEVVSELHPSEQLRVLEKLAMKIRKENNIRIELERLNAHFKFKKQKIQWTSGH